MSNTAANNSKGFTNQALMQQKDAHMMSQQHQVISKQGIQVT
jgi:hypothetical protein